MALDVGQVIAGLAAAAACLYAAARASSRAQAAWRLLALSAAGWCVGDIARVAYEVVAGVALPFPSPSDVGHAVAIPLAAAGILAFPAAPSSPTSRARAVVDGLIVASTLALAAWAFGLTPISERAPLALGSRALVVAYPAADILLVALLAAVVRKASGRFRVTLLLLAGAYLATLVADRSFAFVVLQGDHGVLRNALEMGWVAGFILLALAALWPPGPAAGKESEEAPGELWQFAIPWLGAASAIAVNTWYALGGRRPDPIMLGISCTVGGLFVLSQVLAMKDSLGWLERSRDAERQLRERTGLLDEVIDRAPLGIARVGDDFRIIDANPRLSEMLALPARALVGASMRQFLTDEEVARAHARMELMRKGEVDRIEVDGEMRSADGRMLFVHRSITPVFNAQRRIHYYLVMFEDITAKHESERAALDNLAALERLSRLKSEFMSMVSHEFRTALTGIQGYSEVMTTQEVSTDEVKEFAGDINADALRLNRMITEMLDLDRIESGRMQLHMEAVDLNRLLAEAVDRARMSTQRHDVVTDLDPRVGAVNGDRDRLIQVVSNLLNNAIKYSPNGGEIAVMSKLQEGNVVEVSVRDHGQGIPPEFSQRIFGRYERYEAAGVKDVVGTGLGLAIAQQIVQLHKGRIWVESKLGEGSTFRFAIPATDSGIKVA